MNTGEILDNTGEILDALANALKNRNRDKDEDLVRYWIDQLGTHRGMLMDCWLEQVLGLGVRDA